MEIMEKYKGDGGKVPDNLDPSRRHRGRHKVEDGPIPLISQSEFETHISEVKDEKQLGGCNSVGAEVAQVISCSM